MSTRRFLRTVGPMMLAAGLCFSATGLAAQRLQVIKIQAGVMTKRIVGHTNIGVPIEETTVSRLVNYSDLDLRTYAGTVELKRRVRAAARAACQRLDELYPIQEKNAPECIHSTLARTARQVDDVIAAAQKKAGTP